MKIILIDQYHILHTDTNQPIYCNKRTPTFMPVPSRGLAGSMEIATMQGPIHFCGDHCPFFYHKGSMLEIKCNVPEPLINKAEIQELPASKPTLKLS